MLQTVRLAMKINLRPDRLPVIVMVEQELPQFLHGLAFGQGGGSVDFHPVACGKNDGFRDNAVRRNFSKAAGMVASGKAKRSLTATGEE